VAVGDAGAGVFYVILLFFFSTAVYKLLWCPDRPSNLRGNWQDALVILTWDASPTAKNYQVHYRPKGYETIKWQSVRTTNTNRFSVTITNGVPYEIYIVAENLYGFSFGSSKMHVMQNSSEFCFLLCYTYSDSLFHADPEYHLFSP
jgi:hypothetical protein